MDGLFDVFEAPAPKKRPIAKESDDNAAAPAEKKVKQAECAGDLIIAQSVDREPCVTQAMPTVVQLETMDSCVHEVAIPPGFMYTPLAQRHTTPAKEYKFSLDGFQREALKCVENSQSVLVSAHTSAGKTVVAEYAVATSLRDKQRVIYTTPIKALSNQKFRELTEEFKDVGLMTGDVTINPTASCLVMTTEILRSMLYRGSEVMREVGWVIFDEIHYMRDKERGVVWEETLILLPDNVHYVFLSATIPNARQFAQWISVLHKQPCHVVYTEYRPTPLQHYIFPAGADGLYLVVDEAGEFREDNFQKAMSLLNDAPAGPQAKFGRKGGFKGDQTSLFKIIRMIMERSLQPVIIFSFSKKECEAYAMQLSKLDFNTEEEKKLVVDVFSNAIDTLSEEDRHLPQVEHVLPLLKRGIGIHHGGLLPILKETIEILFGEGLVKALFATETFSMGLNMPAKTVVFTSVRKFDGHDFRWVTGGEYIQMSGRAGRRGLDDKGLVMLMMDEKMEPTICKDLVKGTSDPLNSAFRLTYNMVLNLLRVEEINPEYMLERSFYQFQNASSVPELEKKLSVFQDKLDSMVVARESEISTYYDIRQLLDKQAQRMKRYTTNPRYLLGFLQPGRLVQIKNGDDDYGWAVVVAYQKKTTKSKAGIANEVNYLLEVLLHCALDTAPAKLGPKWTVSNLPKPCGPGDKGSAQVHIVPFSYINGSSSVRLYLPKDLKSPDSRVSVLKSLRDVLAKFRDGLPQLDPVADMNIQEEGFKKIVERIVKLEERLYKHSLHEDPDVTELFSAYSQKLETLQQVQHLKKEIRSAQTILQLDELKGRKRVLRRLGYASAADVIEMKGRVACEVGCADELVLTELIFNGAFNDLSVEQITALLSCFSYDEKSNEEKTKIPEELAAAHRLLQETARRIARISAECRLDLDEETYVSSFNPGMLEVVLAWSKKATFAEICKMTETYEGSIIRCFRRLEELLRQMAQAAKVIGNMELEKKFSMGITCIKRDIVFAASLYL
ncbi:exosome RNA helicase MTR4-like [Sycon ciliatum]|uniref:exosome RNA helicase MTR4-like n=1 Tax=Sycon ciliatum TaxID=27933 RepID=UPI0031F6B55A